MIRTAGKRNAHATSPQILAEGANSAVVQLGGHPLHVLAGVAAREAMEQKRRTVAGSPGIRTVVVHHNRVVVADGDAMLRCPIR
jgi:hypothetical protein